MKKSTKAIVTGIALFLLLSASCQGQQASLGKRGVVTDPKAFNDTINGDAKILVIDVRDQADYEAAHIDNSINMPYIDGTEVERYIKEKVDAKGLSVYIICYAGNRAAKVFNYLQDKAEYDLYYVKFGYGDFVAAMGDDYTPASGPCPCLTQ